MKLHDLRTNEELCIAHREGDPDALAVLCDKNEDYLTSLAKEVKAVYPDAITDVEDLVSEGYCGMIRAVQTYDPAKDTQFMTYAYHWIMKYMRKEFFKDYDPEHLVFYINDLLKEDDSFDKEEFLMQMSADPAPIVFRNLTIEAVRHSLSLLRPREREYLEMKFGIGSEIGKHRKDTAEYYHLRVRRAAELEKAAFQGMRERLGEEKWLYYDIIDA